ncbi:zinc-binding dehydrogenase [Rhodococcus sp. D2-41]|uniref:Zinc-binding dehydrogenase n=1 Tax=Speluncibacter jeojiensis TaxID=2710754 RepID=A0A9X4RCK3_9ACTN|nr:zinc-binding dehydrogenase [Rhodococcus sp. D2-41]MDG3013673.1 zinc-binding dehydrogenase [Corynebacteriales bacterium D3-21]
MRRVRYRRNGGPEVLFLEQVPEPTAGVGELVVRTEAIGVTLPVVRKVREGSGPAPLGGEVAGEVGSGEGVDGFAVGDRVTGLCFGHDYGDLLGPSVAALDAGGRLVAYSSGGGTVNAYDLLVGAKSVIGFQMARIALRRPELYEAWRQEPWALFGAGRIRPVVHATFALADTSAAHSVIESHANRGKVVLVP